MENPKDRDEYVLNDIGAIWKGSYTNQETLAWSYGIFDEGVLDACLIILEQSKIPILLRSSPVYVAKRLSKMVIVNSNCVKQSG